MAEVIATTKAPAAIGPYVQGQIVGNLVFVSGQLGLNPDGTMPETFEDQAHNSLKNLQAILEEAGSSLSKVVKSAIFLTDLENFAACNSIYATYFKAPYPARSCVQVGRLPKDGLVEIEVVAER